jgi:hypothetical protein
MFRSSVTGIISLAGKYLLKTSKLETASSNIGTVGFSIRMNLFPTYCTDYGLQSKKLPTFTVQAGLVLCQGYAPDKHGTDRTQNFHLKQCFSLQLGFCQTHPV